MKKRFRLWDNAEAYALERLEGYGDPAESDALAFIPSGMEYEAGGTEFSDLMYITHGTKTLKKAEIEKGTYPADVYDCKKALKAFFTFFHTPEELKGKPDYYISDDDRLYWWDGTDEVVLSDEMDGWLRELAVRHKEILTGMKENMTASDRFLQEFLALLAEIDEYYKHIFPFQNMFYEFLQNGSKIEYRAATELLRLLSDENREEGKIIEKAGYRWDITSRNVTHNAGRIKIKRYLSVMANHALRLKYFGF